MNRRNFLGSAVAGAAWPLAPACAATPTRFRLQTQRLALRHTWTTTMSSSTHRDVIYFLLSRGAHAGIGEGAPIVRYGESAADAQKFAGEIAAVLHDGADLMQYRKIIGQLHRRLAGQWALKSALDIAIHDWVGQVLDAPVYKLLGLDPLDAPVTTFSIGIDTPEVTREKVKEAEAYPILKIKVGLKTDEATIDAVRSVTKKPLRVDANEGWKTKEEAVAKINWLEKQGVEFVEQPLPAHMLEDMNFVRSKVHIPVIADEASLHPADIPKLAPYFDGVNVKLDKCGGILEALRMIEMAKSLGLKTMLGCMVSSSVAITAAAHLSPLVDYADLDGNLLISNDPYVGVTVEAGKLILPSGAGLGLKPRAA
ncbi:MAG: dipeptide epimerase [Bryobacterales bacterium]|nr:dipeptide epimerase [Bryobacterales bacterium]